MPNFFTQRPAVQASFEVTGDLQQVAEDVASFCGLSVSVVDDGLEWMGWFSTPMRAELGQFVVAQQGTAPSVSVEDPASFANSQPCPEGAVYAFETPTAG